MLCVCKDNKRKYQSLGISVNAEHWDFKSNHPIFGVKYNTISMFDFLNLLTEANKSSYTDSYLQRAVNATEVTVGINNALHGDSKYAWFLG